jgi:hypothetical protein
VLEVRCGEEEIPVRSFRMQMQAGTESVIWFGGNSWYGKYSNDFALGRRGGGGVGGVHLK